MRRVHSRRFRKRRIAGLLLLLSGITWVAGLFFFLHELPEPEARDIRHTDAVIVLTGGSLRLETGLELLGRGMAEKLFVSGVHRGVDVSELLRVSRQAPGRLDCCIALGYNADDTIGNALETRDWMATQGYTSLRLVTGNYHMPRSLIEFRRQMPQVEIIPHAVFPPHVKTREWYRWPGTAALIIGEYNKILFAPIRWALAYVRDRVASE